MARATADDGDDNRRKRQPIAMLRTSPAAQPSLKNPTPAVKSMEGSAAVVILGMDRVVLGLDFDLGNVKVGLDAVALYLGMAGDVICLGGMVVCLGAIGSS